MQANNHEARIQCVPHKYEISLIWFSYVANRHTMQCNLWYCSVGLEITRTEISVAQCALVPPENIPFLQTQAGTYYLLIVPEYWHFSNTARKLIFSYSSSIPHQTCVAHFTTASTSDAAVSAVMKQ